MDIILISTPITRTELKEIADRRFGDMVKGVADIEKKVLALGGDLHADEEAFCSEQGSEQKNLWGINLYPGSQFPDMVEFDSMINIRPGQNNRSRSVEDETLRGKILEIVKNLVN